MASGNVSKVLRAPGRLVIKPTDLSVEFPYGGIEVGKTKLVVLTSFNTSVRIEGEGLGNEASDILVDGLNRAGWEVEKPKATMFVWAPIPEAYRHLGSLEFSKLLIQEAKVAVSPGIGFGEYGDDHVRFALIENEHRTRQAVRGLRSMFRRGVGSA